MARRSRILRAGVVAAALGACLPAFADDAPAKCRLVRIAEWPVHFVGTQPVVDGAINGKKVGVLVDTGAYASLITKDAANRLGLNTRQTAEYMEGVGGSTRVLITRVDELRIAEASAKNMRVRVAGERPFPGVDFILGEDFLGNLDLELDYAKSVLRLYKALGCQDANLAYWDPGASQLPMEDERHIIVPIAINGKEVRAMIDSGASASVVSLDFAERVGVTPQSPGVTSAECTYGVGAETVHSWLARFDTVTLDEETIHDPHLMIEDFLGEMAYSFRLPPLVIIGSDFLHAHRMLVARSQQKVYFSYTGGRAFPANPGFDCDDRLRGKNREEAATAYDALLAENPKDTKALLGRAQLRVRQRDLAGARGDLDAVIQLEPGSAPAWAARSALRILQGDYDGALADSGAAIARGFSSTRLYLARAQLRAAKGDVEGAVREYGDALALDPHHRDALRSRGRYLFHTGKYEAAEADFAALLALGPNAWDAIWWDLCRKRHGLDGRAFLEPEAAKLKDDAWPAPLMLFLMGRMDQQSVLAAAQSADEKARPGRVCEARFYLALGLIAQGHADGARGLLESARQDCPAEGFIRQEAAALELAKLR